MKGISGEVVIFMLPVCHLSSWLLVLNGLHTVGTFCISVSTCSPTAVTLSIQPKQMAQKILQFRFPNSFERSSNTEDSKINVSLKH